MANPLLDFSDFPDFSLIKPSHVVPAIRKKIKNYKIKVNEFFKQSSLPNWENFCQILMEADNDLQKVWSFISHLNSVRSNQIFRKEYEKGLVILTEHYTEIIQNRDLYLSYKNIQDRKLSLNLSFDQEKSIKNILKDFELSGIKLSKEKKTRYKKLVQELAKLESEYGNNVLDSTINWNKLINDSERLNGLSETILSNISDQAKRLKKKGWLLTLEDSIYFPVQSYCEDSELREELYFAYNTRASDQGPDAGKWNNGPVMFEILSLRQEIAKMLGFKNYMDKSVSNKMMKSSERVLNFLLNLINRVRSKGEIELEKLKIFAKKKFGCNHLKPWDILFYSEKRKKYLFRIDNEELRLYFPESVVLKGLFKIVNYMYRIKVVECYDSDKWHIDVRFFRVFDQNNQLIGCFYLDIYSRKDKQGGAWMGSFLQRMCKSDGTLQKPTAYLICNFNRPTDGNISFFTHSDIITLFHEFGHVLHHLLTRVEIPNISGTNGVPWDVVELPSQFMENYCWEPEVLKLISCYRENGNPISDKLISNLLKTKNYQSSFFLLRQIELSLFDFFIHTKDQLESESEIISTFKKARDITSLTPFISWTRFPNTFSHIFSGGYAAGYYSYLWSDVLSSDIWFLFKKNGIFNEKISKSFLDNVLSRGGSEDPNDLFFKFRGSKPNIKYMLIRHGIE